MKIVENSAEPCDVGRPVAEFASHFPHVDFTSVDPVWIEKTSRAGRKYAYNKRAIIERGSFCLEGLYSRPQKVVFVVSHSGFLRVGVTRCWFFNADYRIFEFADELEKAGDESSASASPNERPGTPSRRALRQDEGTVSGGMGLSWTETVELGDGLPDSSEAQEEPK